MSTVADLRAAGLTHLRIACDGCRCIMAVPWQLMPLATDGLELDDVRRRLRCRECGCRPVPTAVSPWSQSMASGYQAAFKV